MQNYYVVLGISKGADLGRIKKAYRSVVKKYHPDVARTQESKERFLEIREAYDTLTDEARKRQYDVELERHHSSFRVRGVPEIVEIRISWWNDMEEWFTSPADEFFEGFLPGFFDRDRRRAHEEALFFEAILSPEEAGAGGHSPVTVPVLAPCPECGTSGLGGPLFLPDVPRLWKGPCGTGISSDHSAQRGPWNGNADSSGWHRGEGRFPARNGLH